MLYFICLHHVLVCYCIVKQYKVQYFSSETILFVVIGSNGHRLIEGGIGDDFASVGFDGKHIWLGGEKFSPNTYSKSPRLHKQQVCLLFYYYLCMC